MRVSHTSPSGSIVSGSDALQYDVVSITDAPMVIVVAWPFTNALVRPSVRAKTACVISTPLPAGTVHWPPAEMQLKAFTRTVAAEAVEVAIRANVTARHRASTLRVLVDRW